MQDNGGDCSATPTLPGPNSPPANSYWLRRPLSGVSYKGIWCTYPAGSTTANQGWPAAGATNWANYTGPAITCTPGAGLDNPGNDYGSAAT